MPIVRLVVAALLLAIVSAQAASGQERHWLVGAWEGGRKNVAASSRTGSDRTLIVKSVAHDGLSAKARWVVSTATIAVTLAIAGDVLTFTTPGAQGNAYRLTRIGDVLDGTWTTAGSGHGGSVELRKK